jgi:hypothetical protein
MKLYISLFVVLFYSCLISAQTTEDSVVSAAQLSLKSKLELIPAGSEKLYGFDSRENFSSCTVGKPIAVYSLSKDGALVFTGEWRVPVIYNGVNKTLLTVMKTDKGFETVDLGGARLAFELQAYEPSDFRKLYLLRLYRIHSDFITVTSDDSMLYIADFIPLESGKMFLQSHLLLDDGKNSYSFDELKRLSDIYGE